MVKTFQKSSTDGDPHSDQPSTPKTDEIVAKVTEVICSNHHLTLHDVAEQVNISKSVCHEIIIQD